MITEFDTVSCFDRSPPVVIFLAYAKARSPHEIKNILRKALLGCRYHATLVHGPSILFNKHSSSNPFCGAGQGSTYSTSSWVLLENRMVKVYTEDAYGRHMKDPTKINAADGTVSAFVDDAKLAHNTPDPSATQVAIQQVTVHDTQHWVNRLWASGGWIHIKKSYTKLII